MSTPRDASKPTGPTSFEHLSSEAGHGTLTGEFLAFLRYNKKWWLLPILVVLAVIGLLVALSGSAAAPFIYTLF
ncbi:DUF5989 family protein [Tautonia sp. JC769]|uniref:DUF5989 family protein n=1 Tax=Tautonia sp. JC769 TaxID=3232135 RepID=UPI00345888F3